MPFDWDADKPGYVATRLMGWNGGRRHKRKRERDVQGDRGGRAIRYWPHV